MTQVVTMHEKQDLADIITALNEIQGPQERFDMLKTIDAEYKALDERYPGYSSLIDPTSRDPSTFKGGHTFHEGITMAFDNVNLSDAALAYQLYANTLLHRGIPARNIADLLGPYVRQHTADSLEAPEPLQLTQGYFPDHAHITDGGAQ